MGYLMGLKRILGIEVGPERVNGGPRMDLRGPKRELKGVEGRSKGVKVDLRESWGFVKTVGFPIRVGIVEARI